MRWYVKVTTQLGSYWLWANGYKTKREAERVAEMARNIPENISVTIEKW